MRAFLAIVRLELNAAVRSRAVLLLTLAALGWSLAAPFVLQGDGTASGWFELRVRYSLGVVFALTLVTLAATAAGSLSRERAARRLQLTLVRPAPRFVIALGRMVALSSIGAAVLGLAALALAAGLMPSHAAGGYGATCDRVLEPALASPAGEVDRRLEELRRDRPDFLARTGEREVRRYLLDYVTSRYETIRPGETGVWAFAAADLPADTAMAVRLRLTDVLDRGEPADGLFRLGRRTGRLTRSGTGRARIELAPDAADAAADAASPGTLTFENRGGRGVSLCPYRDLQLLVAADAFAWNLLRAWLVMSALVAFAVAAAVFLGACLGRSVAVFSTVALLFVASVSPSLLEEYPDPTGMTAFDRLCLRLTAATAAAAQPLAAHEPVARLGESACIAWREVAAAVAWDGVVLPLLLALLSGFVMVRKQDGM